MNIFTKFGEFKDIKVEPYNSDQETYTLSKAEDEEGYMILGFDAPTEDDNVWRFWVECGDEDGHAETHGAELKQEEMELIKQMYFEYKQKGEMNKKVNAYRHCRNCDYCKLNSNHQYRCVRNRTHCNFLGRLKGLLCRHFSINVPE